MTLQCDGVKQYIGAIIMKIIRITENIITNKCIVYKINTRTHNSILLWDYSNGSLDEFIEWYGLKDHNYQYCQIR